MTQESQTVRCTPLAVHINYNEFHRKFRNPMPCLVIWGPAIKTTKHPSACGSCGPYQIQSQCMPSVALTRPLIVWG